MTLIDKLSALTGPDREVDLDLWWECKANRGSAQQPMPDDYRKSNLRMNDAPRYTASIDAAMTLARSDAEAFGILADALVSLEDDGWPKGEWAKQLPRHICLAYFKGLES